MERHMPIEKWMSPNPVVVSGALPFLEVLKVMDREKISCVLITDDGIVEGIFSERDVVNYIAVSGCGVLEEPIEKHMTKNPISVESDEDYDSVYLKMYINNIRHVPVLKEKKLVGIVSIRDLLRFRQNMYEEELSESRLIIQELNKMLNLSKNEQIAMLTDRVKKLEELSLTDHLTGLYNFRYFEKRIREEYIRAKRYKQALSLVFCDIDYFKKINDTYGHSTGDIVLKTIGQVFSNEIGSAELVSRLRKSDIVARYGGEEFVIILPQTTKFNAVVIAERIRHIFEETVFQTDKGLPLEHVTLSFGVSECSDDCMSSEDLVVRADSAMYAAKTRGRNCVVSWDDNIEHRIHS
jgi:diguanylate cyclase (GGDEF)-like protein